MSLSDQKLDTMPAGAPAQVFGVDANGQPVLTPPWAITPEMYGADHGADDTVAILNARDAAVAAGAPLYFNRDVYRVSETIDLPSNMGVVILPTVQVRALTGFSGDAVFRVGDAASSDITQYVGIQGGGVIDVNNKCDMGIDFANAAFCRADKLRILGANLIGIRVGDTNAPNTSYEVDISSVRCFQNQLANVAGSVGIQFDKATDSFIAMCYSIGYRRGFRLTANSGSIDLSQCHAWIRPVHGVMDRAFEIAGRRNSLLACYADTPSNYGDGAITDLSCFYISGLNNILRGCKAYMTTGGANGALATDGAVAVVKTSTEVYSTAEVMVGGSDATHRWKTRTEGSTRTLNAQIIDQGEFYSASETHNATFSGSIRPLTTTIAGLPGSIMRENSLAMITDPASGKGRLVYHDGSGWRYVSDDSAV